ncbi:MAG: hypothetical protein ACTSPI_18065, partial [Candidatus Heimdallarchaeaceae archaeon]
TTHDVIPPMGIIEKAKLKGVTVRWKHKNVNVGQIVEKIYQLDYFPYLFRAKKIVENISGEILLKTAKYIYSKENEDGYKLMYILKSMKTIDKVITIEDKIPTSHIITKKEPEEVQLMEENKDEKFKIITLIIDAPKKNEETRFCLNINGDTPPFLEMFKISVGENEETEVFERETTTVREMIKLPEMK